MKQIRISGGKKLSGEVDLQCAKNAVLPILAASLLTREEVVIRDCPPLADVKAMLGMLGDIGCRTRFSGETLALSAADLSSSRLNESLMRKIRSSIFILGPLLARTHRAVFCCPGGCEIGARPIDLHLKGLRDLGVTIRQTGGEIECSCGRSTGGEVRLDYPSVGATENLMMFSVLSDGATVIRNAAREPEIRDLAAFLCAMGARVSGAGSSVIFIHGVDKMHGCTYKPMRDRIVAGTFMTGCAACTGELMIRGADPSVLRVPMALLARGGVVFKNEADGLRVVCPGRFRASKRIETMPYPGFPTDLQSPMLALSCVADGETRLVENVFENRFRLADELKKMGADVSYDRHACVVRGRKRLQGSRVLVHDLRGGAALVMAGLQAEGETVVLDTGLIDRGYVRLTDTLRALGAEITEKEEPL